MRRALPLPLASLLLAAPVASAGCFAASSSGGGGGTNFHEPDGESFDSGAPVDASFDSSVGDVTIDVAADVTVPVDSGVPEASPVEAEAGPALVTVAVTNASGPESGVTVAFQSATGSVITSVPTGPAGTASYLAAAGSQITVVMGTPALPYLLTIQGVAPGDVLAVYDPSADVPYVIDNSAISVQSVPSPTPSGVDAYTVQTGGYVFYMPAETASFPFSVTVGPGSVVGGKASVLVTGLGTGASYAWQKGVALPDGGGTVETAVGGAWTSSTNNLVMTGTGMPAFAQGQSATEAFSMIADAVPFTQNAGGQVVALDAGLYQTFAYPAGFADAVQVEGNVNTSMSPYVAASISAVATRAALPDGDAGIALDLSQMLPEVTTAAIDSTNPAQPIVTWSPTDAGALAASDGLVVSLVWGNPSQNPGVWTVVAPPTSTQVQVPLLPASANAFTPDAGAAYIQPTVAFVHASFLGSYPALRAQAGTAGLTAMMLGYAANGGVGGYLGTSPIVPPLPANGTLVMSAITQSGD